MGIFDVRKRKEKVRRNKMKTSAGEAGGWRGGGGEPIKKTRTHTSEPWWGKSVLNTGF